MGTKLKENVDHHGAIRKIDLRKFKIKLQGPGAGLSMNVIVRTASMEEETGRVTKFWFRILLVLCASIACTTAVDTISANQTIRDNGDTIVSAQGTFELGFFSPQNSTNRYVGIWYNKIASGTVVWVANRNTPLTSSTSGELSLTLQGILELRNSTGDVVWSSANSSAPSVGKPVAQLLDTGNFIVTNSTPENPIWQSFDFPTDTLLAGMKFGKDLVTGLDRHLTSWKSEADPSVGEFSAWIETEGYPQLVLRDGPNISFRVGPWNGLSYSGSTALKPNPYFTYGFVLDQREMYYHFEIINKSVPSRLVIQPTGAVERLVWFENIQKWLVNTSSALQQRENCNRYSLCGSFGSCDNNDTPACSCLEGFVPTSPDAWNLAYWSQGCRRSTPLDCGSGESFRKYPGLKLPDTRDSRFNQSMNLDECEKFCKRDCSCTAYTTQNISGSGSGCLLWFGNLTDIRTLATTGQDIHIRLAASEFGNGKNSSIKIIVPIISVLLVMLLSVGLFYRLRRKPKQEETLEEDYGEDSDYENSNDDLELPLIDFSALRKATNNFSDNNKLGEGGFGPVYKGVLENGQEVAVKRLARNSTQGFREFKNEVICISKLQHRNLVRLLACCIKGEEKLLVYEYMPNKGLDYFIFDGTRSKVLNWPMCFNIIKGIARGLVYLHQDSRLRIIHRDLKASNILLDHDMVPKISDFGIARSFGGHQIEANTDMVVGTYGYMAPEYATDGIFSIKSDVFSFGVLVLEIVCGKKNRGFFHKDNNLLGHAWRLHNEGRSLELVAAYLDESIQLPEVLRSVHISLLCAQQHPEDRPTMSSVVMMFESERELPPPKPPGFFYEQDTTDVTYPSSTYETISSTNELTITMLNAR